MRSATSSSWELRFDVLEEPHIALFIRDALRFESSDGRQPPRLEGEVPDLRSVVGEEQSPQIMLGFRSWWQEEHLIDEWRVAPPVNGPEDWGESHRRLEARLANFYAPLAGQPELRRHASDWFAEHRERYEPRDRHHEDAKARWEISKDAAEAAAAEVGIEPGELSADTWLMMVRGLWWATPQPGQLLYSPAVREDRSLLANLLQDTFTASVGR
jgi:hypothetical protein